MKAKKKYLLGRVDRKTEKQWQTDMIRSLKNVQLINYLGKNWKNSSR